MNTWCLTSVAIFLAHCGRAEAAACSEEAAAPEKFESDIVALEDKSEYLRDLKDLGERALKSLAAEAENLERVVGGLSKVECAEESVRDKLGDLVKLVEKLGDVEDLRRNMEDIAKTQRDLGDYREVARKACLSLLNFIFRAPACLDDIRWSIRSSRDIYEKLKCLKDSCEELGSLEDSQENLERFRVEGLVEILGKLECFRGRRRGPGGGEIASPELADIDLEALRRDVSDAGFCFERLESFEDIERLRERIGRTVAKIKRVECARENEREACRIGARLGIEGLGCEDVERLSEIFERRIAEFESVGRRKEEMERLARRFGESVVERAASLRDIAYFRQVEEKHFDLVKRSGEGVVYGKNLERIRCVIRVDYKRRSPLIERKCVEALFTLRREFVARIEKRRFFMRYLDARLSVLRRGFECLARVFETLEILRKIEEESIRGFDKYEEFELLRTRASRSLKSLQKSVEGTRGENTKKCEDVTEIGREFMIKYGSVDAIKWALNEFNRLEKNLEKLEEDIAKSARVLGRGCDREPSVRENAETSKSELCIVGSFGRDLRRSIESLEMAAEEGHGKKRSLAWIFGRADLRKSLESLRRSTVELLAEHREIESERLCGFQKVLEGARSEIHRCRDELGRRRASGEQLPGQAGPSARTSAEET